MAEPVLTIDFKGLCAFVSNAEDPKDATHVDVIMLAAEKAISKPKLCRHDPVLVFREKDFERAGDRTQHIAFQTYFSELPQKHRDQDIGVWDLRGESLTLEGEKLPTGKLKIDPSFEEILSLGALTGGDARVLPKWTNGDMPAGVAARLRIDHGVLSGGPHVTGEYGLATLQASPTAWFPFRQSARWEVYAKPETPFLFLKSGKDEWVQLREGAHILISNLCPLAPGGIEPDVDVLAYYAMAKAKVKVADRLVFHRKPQGLQPPPPPSGFPVRPGASACPPLRGYAEAA